MNFMRNFIVTQKNYIKFLLTLLFVFLLSLPVCALATATDTEEETRDMSEPRLMVTDFSVGGGFLAPGEKTKLSVTFRNTNAGKSIRNIKLTLSEDSGELAFEGMGTTYVSYIGAGGEYTWETSVTAAHTAQTGKHSITVTGEYEDVYYSAYQSADVLGVNVKQPAALDFDNALLPVRVIQGDTVTVSVNLMNTGKCTVSNVKLVYSVAGLTTGGSTFVGEIPAGESKTAGTNFRVSDNALGDAKGTLTVSFEDPFGETHTKTAELKTVIEKKPVLTVTEEENDENGFIAKIKWWIWLVGGIIAGGLAAFGITAAVYSSKIRQMDEMRL